MSSERSRLKEARKRLLSLNFEVMGLELERAIRHGKPSELPETEYRKRLDELDTERNRQIDLLNQYESEFLIRKAQSWGIEVPYKKEWYSVEIKNPDPDNIPGETITAFKGWLNEVGKAVINKKIRDERFAYWKGWAELLVPILSLVGLIIALLK